MRLFVTGGCGFIGRYLARAALARGDSVVLYDLVPPKGALAQEVEFVEGDLGSIDQIVASLERFDPTAILHLAAVVGAPSSMDAPVESMRTNVEGTLRLLEAARRFGKVRVVHLSSEETYGDFEREAIDEDHPQRPITPYGVAKSAAEGFCRYYRRYFDVDVVSARTSWVYGVGLPRLRPPGSLLEPAVRGEPSHHPYGADYVVDYTSVYDVVDGLLALAAQPRLERDAYHLTSGQATSNRDLVKIVQELVPGARVAMDDGPWFFAPERPAPRKGAMRYDRAQRETGYRPHYDIRSGLGRYLQDLRSGKEL